MLTSTDSFFCETYNELRSMASRFLSHERIDHTLSATALVHEAYGRLSAGRTSSWESRGHFFSSVARNMRQVLVEHARRRRASKRRHAREWVDLQTLNASRSSDWNWLLDFDDALYRLSRVDADAADFVSLRVFSGLSIIEVGEAMGLSKWSSYQLWEFARRWFASNANDENPSRQP